MPFAETQVMDQRQRFVYDTHCSLLSFSELCRRYGISRKTGYKWVERWLDSGPDGLQDRNSRPCTSPLATPGHVVEAILDVRKRHTDYGAKKVTWYLQRNRPELQLPSLTTIHNILHRHGLVPERRRRVRRWHPGQPTTEALHPNAIWSMDFKGQFRTRDGQYCFPLTVQDVHSRFVLACQGRLDVSLEGVRPVFVQLFREHGLPERIRSDNGAPFASSALGRLSQLSVWFIRLGIMPELIEPASPQQNGKHENMHLVLKRQATRPPKANLTARPYPRRLEPLTYPSHFEGSIKIARQCAVQSFVRANPVVLVTEGVQHALLRPKVRRVSMERRDQVVQSMGQCEPPPRRRLHWHGGS